MVGPRSRLLRYIWPGISPRQPHDWNTTILPSTRLPPTSGQTDCQMLGFHCLLILQIYLGPVAPFTPPAIYSSSSSSSVFLRSIFRSKDCFNKRRVANSISISSFLTIIIRIINSFVFGSKLDKDFEIHRVRGLR